MRITHNLCKRVLPQNLKDQSSENSEKNRWTIVDLGKFN